MSDLHTYVGWPIPIGFGVLGVWALITFFANRDPGGAFWNLLGVMQVIVGVQVIVGGILFLTGAAPPTEPVWLHYAYGGLFPAALLIGAHRIARNYEGISGLIFGIASVLICGLTARALMTGLGS